MGRQPRQDWPGAWHHVMNRGIARRRTFEGQIDHDCFHQFLHDVSKQGLIEIHAYSSMSNHFHLLVRSQRGTLSEAMRRLASRYVRVFNRLRERDGALFRSRFTSRLVTSEAYWFAVLRYIDRNPVSAGITSSATEYPYGSAWWYARTAGPTWLHREVVEAAVTEDFGRRCYLPSDYAAFCASGDLDWQARLVEERLKRRPGAVDLLDRLLDPGDCGTSKWVRAAALADGAKPGMLLAEADAVADAVARVQGALCDRSAKRLEVGLLRTVSGLTLSEIAKRLARTKSWAFSRLQEHREAMVSDERYIEAVGTTLRRAIGRGFGRRIVSGVIPLAPSPTDRV